MDKMHWLELKDNTKIRMKNEKPYTSREEELLKKIGVKE